MSTSAGIKASSSYHHGNLREALVAAGLVLVESGASAELSLRELARQVGVSANAAYRHFENKEALLAAMAAEGFRQLTQQQMQAVMAKGDAVEKVLAGGRAYVTFARQHPALFRLMFGRFSVAHRSPEIEASARLSYEGMRHGVAIALNKDVASAEVRAAATYAWSLVHGLSHLILDEQLDAPANDIDVLIDDVLRQAGDMIRRSAEK